ncbi:MAG: hypothetical protein WDA16_10365 [Candidatus Thermoplasmatota archaeon]
MASPTSIGGALLALILVTGAAVASMLVTYPVPATQSFSLRGAPVVWAAGPDSTGNGFVASWSLSSNATYYTITLKPVPEANVTWSNLTTLTNADTQAWNVVVSGSSVSAYPKIVGFRMEFYNYAGGALVGAMNLTAASPSVNLGSLAAGANYYVKSYIQLATGTSASDLPASIQISLTLS